MSRRKNPPPPGAAPRAKAVARPMHTVQDVMAKLDGLPVARGEAGRRIERYLTEKRQRHPEWWSTQSLEALARLSQVFAAQ